ncbi:hypothetical protein KY328_01040 [Candidatus Woesearchaeota archaeon]|nr:hypothetical protein [Candidatus Woesearchaeota archaeon]MBW3021482.1 hypothetical protein [Candidatus Woesearchaeota archaeon]
MSWKEKFKKGKELILSTCSNNTPHSNIVISLGFVDDKLLVADCQMETTIKNLKENNKITVIGGYLRIKGTADIFSSGKYYDFCVKNTKDYKVKNAIVINVKEVFDMDKAEGIQ